ncbi:hyaluronidase-4 isoform X2 [Syngnathus scovelli]|uniref:hyaluronidase-4 isoform X2 n=1 Tax=Syngnathus scovelli TaxID=161590 RepID=UPI0021106465|nr:hyaluronidase-4 isoform X2 [Syngnathus scovelli]
MAGGTPAGLRLALTVRLLLLLPHGGPAQKPARPPLVGRRPFVAAWNAPLDMCAIKYNVSMELDGLFHIRGSPRADWTGQNVTIFYANRLGYYPRYTAQGEALHGGVPQNGSLDVHLLKAYRDIQHFIPARDFRGLAVIDWEFWRPQWSRNWHKKDVYRRQSRELTAKAYLNVTAAQVEELAQRRFEKSAREFMQRTLQLGTRMRPDGLWGFYLYPDCHNYNLHEDGYTGLCPAPERLRNDELRWLWNSSTALFPSVAIRKAHGGSAGSLRFARHRVREALRVASLTSRDHELPIYVYLRLGYRDEPLTFLTTKDLVHTMGESAALGAAGFVIWGDLNLTTSRAMLPSSGHFCLGKIQDDSRRFKGSKRVCLTSRRLTLLRSPFVFVADGRTDGRTDVVSSCSVWNCFGTHIACVRACVRACARAPTTMLRFSSTFFLLLPFQLTVLAPRC